MCAAASAPIHSRPAVVAPASSSAYQPASASVVALAVSSSAEAARRRVAGTRSSKPIAAATFSAPNRREHDEDRSGGRPGRRPSHQPHWPSGIA